MKPTKSLAFALSAARSYTPKYPRARNGIADRPAFHHPDPLLNNPNATVTELDENLTFIHRPPPSAPSPHSTTEAPISPLLLPLETQNGSEELPPLARPQSVSGPVGRTVTDEEIKKMRALRNADPQKYTRKVLAEMFNLPVSFVGFAAGLKKSAWKAATRKQEAVHQASRERWSERHELVKAIQKKRRELW